MSTGDRNDLKNILIYGTPKGTIEVKPHPEDVIEVDPSILIKMQAKLKSESFEVVYGQDERVSSEFLIRKETEKLRRIFGSGDSVNERFTSIKAINELRKELEFEEVNREFLDKYSLKLSGGSFVDECDVFRVLLSDRTFVTKKERHLRFEIQLKRNLKKHEMSSELFKYYLNVNLEPLQITKEIIQLNPDLKVAALNGTLLPYYNELLDLFYGALV